MLFHPKKNLNTKFLATIFMWFFLSQYLASCGAKSSSNIGVNTDEEYLAESIDNSTAKGLLFLAEQINTSGKFIAYFYNFKEGLIVKLAEIPGYTAKGIQLSTGPSFLVNTLEEIHLITFIPNNAKDEKPYTIATNVIAPIELKAGEPFSINSTPEDNIILTAPLTEQGFFFDANLNTQSNIASAAAAISNHSFRPTGVKLDQNSLEVFIASTALNFEDNYTISQDSLLFKFQEDLTNASSPSLTLSGHASLTGDSPLGISLSTDKIFTLSLCPSEAEITCQNGIDVLARDDFSHEEFAAISEPITGFGTFLSKENGQFFAFTQEKSGMTQWVSLIKYIQGTARVTQLFKAVGSTFTSMLLFDQSNSNFYTGEKSLQENQGIIRIYTNNAEDYNSYIPDIPVEGMLVD